MDVGVVLASSVRYLGTPYHGLDPYFGALMMGFEGNLTLF